MRVYIGPHINWIGPYQIAEALCFWVKKVPDKYGAEKFPPWVHDFGTFLAETKDGKESWLTKVCNWIYSKQKRKIKVKIHNYDSWNIDSTLAPIILPLLKQLKETKHGSALVDPEDVPYELQVTRFEEFSNQLLLDFEDTAEYKSISWDLMAKRWDYVMDEMIWAFEQLQPDYDWEEQYRKGEIDIKWTPNTNEAGEIVTYTMDRGPNDTYECDYDALLKHQARIDNGMRLFGKYFQGLWD